jgi:hypothetical protein
MGKPRRSFLHSYFPKKIGGNFFLCLIQYYFVFDQGSHRFCPVNLIPAAPPKYHPRCKASDGNLKPKDIEALWKASSERQAILAGMPESEIKRRRY